MPLPTPRRAAAVTAALLVCALLAAAACAPPALAQDDAPPATLSLPCHVIGPGADEAFGYGATDPFHRELIRQAVLICAREEMGLFTRDAALGEPLAQDAAGGLIDYRLALQHAQPIGVTLTVDGEERASHDVPAAMGRLDGYPGLVDAAEAYSRIGAVKALRACGFQPNPVPRAEPAPLPDELAHQVFDLDFVTQYYLARDLHALIRDDGDNPQRLAALSIAYANLAQLTRFRLDFTHRALSARSMLYARRVISLYPDRPEGHWALAYAWVMFDLPGFGMGHIAEGNRLNDALDAPLPEPGWLALLETYHRYHTFELMDAAREGGPHAELAALLASVSTESSDTPGLMRVAMDLCIEVNPDGLRTFYTDASGTDIVTQHYEYPYACALRLLEAVPDNLRRLGRGRLPDGAERALFGIDPEDHWVGSLALMQSAWVLEDSAIQQQGVELSDAVLGHLIEGAITSNHVILCALNAASDNMLVFPWDTIAHTLGRHPYRDYILICQYHLQRNHQAKRELIRDVTIGDFNALLGIRLMRLDPTNIRFANVDEQTAFSWVLDQKTQTIPDMVWYSRLYEDGTGFNMYSSWIGDAAPHAPLRAISRVVWRDFNQQQLEEHLAIYDYMPAVQAAAADWYLRHGDPDEAFDLLWAVLQRIPDKEIEFETAELALRLGEEDIWLELMNRVHEADPDAPPYVDVQLIIGSTYMQAGRWEEALVYIDQFIEDHRMNLGATYNKAWCLHELGRTDEAIELLKTYDQRYAQDYTYTFLGVMGLDEEADAAAQWYEENVLPRHARRDPRRPHAFETFRLISKGQDQEALEALAEDWEQFGNVNDAIRVVILAQQLGDTELRDRMLDTLAREAESDPNDDRVEIIGRVAQLIMEGDGAPPTDAKIRAFLNRNGRKDQDANAMLNLGWYLIASGEQQRGIDLLVELLAMRYYSMMNYEKYQAAHLLRMHGYDFDNHDWRFSHAHLWPEDYED